MARQARTGEKTLNDRLAALLHTKHPRWVVEAESTRVLADKNAKAPDIVVNMPGGASVLLETEFLPAHGVEEDAEERLGETLAETGDTVEQVVAVRIPDSLAHVRQAALSAALEAERFDYCLVSHVEGGRPHRFPRSGWIQGSVDGLANFVESVALSERRVNQALDVFEDGVSQAANVLRSMLLPRRSRVLDLIASELHQEDGEQTSRMAMTIVANALSFHHAVASTHEDITPFDELLTAGEPTPTALLSEWDRILEINYWPIFAIARRVLAPLPADVFKEVAGRLGAVAETLAGLGLTTVQEMAGQLFGRLIADRKFLATFYTRPASAALLAELAVTHLKADLSQRSALESMRVADLACGTGALLLAAYARISARARRAGLEDSQLHPVFMRDVLIGADIMPAAVHVTAAMLSSMHPAVPFEDTRIILMPYGRGEITGSGEGVSVAALGSLDLIDDVEASSLFGTGRIAAEGSGERSTDEDQRRFVLEHRSADLVIMNPPFARTVGQEAEHVGVPRPAFAGFGTSEDEQAAMSTRLAKISLYRGKRLAAGRGHAGLASYFVDLAHVKVKPGGVVAFVLPATFVSSNSWKQARKLLDQHYEDVVVVSIAAHGSTNRAFSDDTAMAEVLVIARRLESTGAAATSESDQLSKAKVHWVGLADRPPSVSHALAVATAVRERLEDDDGPGELRIGGERIGIFGTGRIDDGGYGQLRELGLAAFSLALMDGSLRLPRHKPLPLPIATLGDLGEAGLGNAGIGVKPRRPEPLARGTGAYAAPFWIRDLDSDSGAWIAASYPVLWAHNARSGRENKLEVAPDSYGELRPGIDDAQARRAWDLSSSRVHVNLDFRLNSQMLSACLTPKPCIGGMAWPSVLVESKAWEVPLVLWMNTTLGLIGHWWIGSRQQQGRSRLSVGRIVEIPVLDCRKLEAEQLSQANELFARFRLRDFRPANEAYGDPAGWRSTKPCYVIGSGCPRRSWTRSRR